MGLTPPFVPCDHGDVHRLRHIGYQQASSTRADMARFPRLRDYHQQIQDMERRKTLKCETLKP